MVRAMPSRSTASEYSPHDLLRVKQTCLYVFSQLPSQLLDKLTVIGGLVPSLLIEPPPTPEDQHLGTADLDIGLALGLQEGRQYEELTVLLGTLGFTPERSEGGRATGVRWKLDTEAGEVLIDILPVVPQEAALPSTVAIPGTELSARTRFAFLDRERVELTGPCIIGEHREVSLWVCGPGAYIVIKALTFDQRHLNKDAYDLFYVLRNYGAGVRDVFPHLAPLLRAPEAQRALDILCMDFADPDGAGACAVPLFLFGRLDDDLQADVVGFTCSLLEYIGMAP